MPPEASSRTYNSTNDKKYTDLNLSLDNSKFHGLSAALNGLINSQMSSEM